ncbi:MAG TPA: OmcA/MtrC family decaheme c-type cytochrome [Bryobacteraceae bacterium]|nr:OmcA/MtrC family decaheme c-type cytochrome [Bryobacteraceae bacterium]
MDYCALRRAGFVAFATILLATASWADRPAKQNRDYNPQAAAGVFNSFTTGANIKIISASIAKDGTITTRFKITDANGNGLDVTGAQTAGVESIRFVAAYIPNGQSQYIAYTTTTARSTTNSNPPQIQAGTDSGGTFTLVDAGAGTYDYTFGTKAPVNFDATATHSIGAQIERDLSAYGFSTTYAGDDVFTFVPNGSAVSKVRDVVNEASCNSCHNPIGAHGSPGPRKKMAFCVLCHTPQSTNPDTYNTVDMKVFIHKLHRGSSLPSVQAGGDYFVIHRGNKQDYSSIQFPQDIRNCTTCHAAGPAQADNWKLNPSQEVCGSCHDDVNFATGENHVNLPQPDNQQCKGCHISQATYDFDASIPGAHVVPSNSAELGGLVGTILKIDNATPGSAPTVTFQVTDKAGNPIDISTLARIRLVLAGPNTDYQTGPGGIQKSEDVSKTPGSNGVYVYTMTNKIPAAAIGSYTISIEATNTATLMANTMLQTTATDFAVPVEQYFSVDNSPTAPRRQVVSSAKCGSCHQNLAFVHGGSRANTQECVICHNPTLADGTSKQSVNFATQIHSIHRGENLTNSYILGTTNYQEVRFPGDLRDCSTCHVNNSYQVDKVGAKAVVASPGGFTPTTGPIAAACQGCHDDAATASHALSNTTLLGEACLACHGNNALFAVDVVHARVE